MLLWIAYYSLLFLYFRILALKCSLICRGHPSTRLQAYWSSANQYDSHWQFAMLIWFLDIFLETLISLSHLEIISLSTACFKNSMPVCTLKITVFITGLRTLIQMCFSVSSNCFFYVYISIIHSDEFNSFVFTSFVNFVFESINGVLKHAVFIIT